MTAIFGGLHHHSIFYTRFPFILSISPKAIESGASKGCPSQKDSASEGEETGVVLALIP
jgi:hypothetical protein